MTTPMVRLRNGQEEVASLVAVTMMSLDKLIEDGKVMVVYELVELCRDPNHKPWGQTGKELKSIGLASQGDSGEWHVHNSIRNVVLSAAIGEGLDMTIGNPKDMEHKNE